MRYVGVLVAIWLLVGAVAVWQRGYFKAQAPSCATVSNVALTVIAGPLNYAGVNPKVTCHWPQPSSMEATDSEKAIELEAS